MADLPKLTDESKVLELLSKLRWQVCGEERDEFIELISDERTRCVGIIDAAIAGYTDKQRQSMGAGLQREMKLKIAALILVRDIIKDVQ